MNALFRLEYCQDLPLLPSSVVTVMNSNSVKGSKFSLLVYLSITQSKQNKTKRKTNSSPIHVQNQTPTRSVSSNVGHIRSHRSPPPDAAVWLLPLASCLRGSDPSLWSCALSSTSLRCSSFCHSYGFPFAWTSPWLTTQDWMKHRHSNKILRTFTCTSQTLLVELLIARW